MKPTILLVVTITFLVCLASLDGPRSKAQNEIPDTTRDAAFDHLTALARANGSVRVIVALKAPFIPEGAIDNEQALRQRASIKDAQAELLSRIPRARNVIKFDYIPYLAVEVDEQTLNAMRTDKLVTGIEEDVVGEAALAESIPMVNAPAAWTAGYTGAGQTVAILDTGVDKAHPFLAGRVVSEACYSSNTASSTTSCPGGVTESTAAGSGVNCPVSVPGCPHGTHVAGIAAGRSVTVNGVAKDANIVAVQVFSIFNDPVGCSPNVTCARYWTSDVIRGLERLRTLKTTIPGLAAANLSLQTSQQFTSNCDAAHSGTKASVDNLRSLGVATIVCSGNFGFTNALTAPACVSSAISVGSVDDGSNGTTPNAVSSFSDSSPLLHLLGPGRWVTSSTPDNNFETYAGTSMATPHVVGAYAILRQRSPNASVGRVYKALAVTGQAITDTRNGVIKPRINIAAALNAINRTTQADFDDDGKTDIAIFRPSVGEWWINRSSSGVTVAGQFGASTDRIVPGDYTGDGRADIAIWRPSTGEWFVLRSEDSSYFSVPFGTTGDIPAPADFDADGKTDPTVFRPSTGTWYISRTSGGTTIQGFGVNGDVPTSGDFDGDGAADIAIYRPSNGQWWLSRSTAGVIAFTFGNSTDKPVQGDYTGDGKWDAAFFRPSTGEWYIARSEDNSYYSSPFGTTGDLPAPGDYDGDGRNDPTVFRPSTGTWYSNRSTAGTLIVGFGTNGDRPLSGAFVP